MRSTFDRAVKAFSLILFALIGVYTAYTIYMSAVSETSAVSPAEKQEITTLSNALMEAMIIITGIGLAVMIVVPGLLRVATRGR